MNAHTEPNAWRALGRLTTMLNSTPLDVSLAAYPKGGFVASFRTVCQTDRWNDAVVEVIGLGQRVAFGWLLSGHVADDLSGWAQKARTSGITAVHWTLSATAPPAPAAR